MKTILITGVNSYIGSSFEKYLGDFPNQYSVDSISLRTEGWKKGDFSKYDAILHVAGIAHVSSDPKMEELYYKVNRDLTIEVAKKAKHEGVSQFVFMSSIIVYGANNNIIDEYTLPSPDNFYGNSKLLAEQGIKNLENDNFRIAIIRPPMIYGKGSKGNYPKLAILAKKTPLFPYISNQRSMLHIDNLCEFIRLMIQNKESGVFFPQNNEFVNTSELVALIAEVHGKKVRLVKLFNPILNFIGRYTVLINKVFGNLVYSQDLSEYKNDYRIRNLPESIVLSEKIDEGIIK
ncbi:NAD-dependent epimerase/dehydratase family protein [Bacillus sp. NTK071]|uniref:NAD-dependent epimerase/dehydratase family protein n=1 Tax=Bacillus sp. NTK071 TaxID=2802175 RepID=UPI001A8C2CF0|nr:NAD-dependent epimerase/dehydratase family protein [Bacillus sp. NTK071]MBN8210248.1 NAD-dependent epimerase/dehydratase family protein [Bacillus sp. NTK071]